MADPISIISVVDLCFKYGALLVERCSAFAHAESELLERSVRVKNYWIRAETQLKLVRSIAHTLDDEHQAVQQETLELLASKLKITVNSIQSVTKATDVNGGSVRQVQRWKYALLRQKIDGAIQDLELWQKMFDPSWYLIMKAATSQIDADLHAFKHAVPAENRAPITSAQSLRTALDATSTSNLRIFLREDGISSLQLTDLPLCSAQWAQREDPSKALILERFQPSAGVNIRQLEKDARDLARKLAHSSPTEFGLLNCKGVVKHSGDDPASRDPTAFTFIFRIPTGYSRPRSLRSCLTEMQGTDSLSDRFSLANELARSVSYVHTFGFVHKNIRPETILLLTNDSSVGSAFLIGFDSFRMAEGKTLRKGDAAWERSLYQHPSRMGLVPTEDYIMQHDIYSLGVCLLELGLWESFVQYQDKTASLPNDGSSLNPTRHSVLGNDLPPVLFKDHLVALARGELRSKMGTRYAEIVETCLTCLDPYNVDFGDADEFVDEDGIQIAVRYIEKVTMKLNNICV
ncbi:hypothetical protein P170DRAFT_437233 [Aspergillus steynii IBT 23096]|uniref:Protein kinase domain-containing protein n=1 Tax=Aspergillus steynii IBT 23096 TaxID=1392250 RepID=A0A2I2G9W6_9EURO|nr:uncharacterized protein P170DRAFT_437233 [Aspergillus steynii IBT 23096]PLB49670.1 hypothetical protein P170DRAFT_437233 [Aspergillus steynii IBT 23096]